MTYKRNGTTTLFAALNILDRNRDRTLHARRHRHRGVHSQLPQRRRKARRATGEEVIHAIVDNHVAHKQPNVLKWLADYPRWTFHFDPDFFGPATSSFV